MFFLSFKETGECFLGRVDVNEEILDTTYGDALSPYIQDK